MHIGELEKDPDEPDTSKPRTLKGLVVCECGTGCERSITLPEGREIKLEAGQIVTVFLPRMGRCPYGKGQPLKSQPVDNDRRERLLVYKA